MKLRKSAKRDHAPKKHVVSQRIMEAKQREYFMRLGLPPKGRRRGRNGKGYRAVIDENGTVVDWIHGNRSYTRPTVGGPSRTRGGR